MNTEINQLKNNLQEVIKKDKEIQELKNKLTLLNKDSLITTNVTPEGPMFF